ncbi:MAG: ATP-binding protein [Ramlibacter sp.]
MSDVGAAKPDPEDGTHTLANLLLFRVGDAIAATFYIAALPWWRPLGWFLLVACSGTIRWWFNSRPGFLALPVAQRRALYRRRTWLHMLALGSAAAWLYAPGNPMLVTLLGVHVLSMATVAALRLSSDFLRNAVAITLIVGPTSLRTLADGLGMHNALLAMMGVGGITLIALVLAASRLHERTLDQQYEGRREAEATADAAAHAGLAKSRFFAAVSHDLRQPVHAIGLYLEPLLQLRHRERLPPDVLRAVEGIRVSWKSLDALLAEVLDLTRMDAGAMQPLLEPVDAGQLVRCLLVEHAATAEERGVRLIALAPEGRFVLADEVMLKRVLGNLLDNAITSSSRNTTVAVTVRRGAGRWRLQVRDAGCGMPAEVHEHVFEEFVQIGNDARERGKGYGLGLAISLRFAHLMGGTLDVRSAVGRGSTMTLTLPATTAAPPSSAPEPVPFDEPQLPLAIARPDAPRCTGTRPPAALRDVLVVEDDPLVADALAQLLEGWGHRTLRVASAAQVLQASHFGQVAICDVRLPAGMSGLELALALRQMDKLVLLVSGETDADLRESAAAHGLEFLVKPVAPAQLHASLRRLATASEMTKVMS